MKKTYGEVVIERLSNLDFTLPIEKMIQGLYSGLPKRMGKEEALAYYTQKLNRYWGAM